MGDNCSEHTRGSVWKWEESTQTSREDLPAESGCVCIKPVGTLGPETWAFIFFNLLGFCSFCGPRKKTFT